MSTPAHHRNIEMIAPQDLTVAPTHARKHSPKQIEQIVRVIDRIGFIVPMVIGGDNVIA